MASGAGLPTDTGRVTVQAHTVVGGKGEKEKGCQAGGVCGITVTEERCLDVMSGCMWDSECGSREEDSKYMGTGEGQTAQVLDMEACGIGCPRKGIG